jgi:hypothetical protein
MLPGTPETVSQIMPHYWFACKSFPTILAKKKPSRIGAACDFHDRTDDYGLCYAANFSSALTSQKLFLSLFRQFGHSRAAKLALTVMGVKSLAWLW